MTHMTEQFADLLGICSAMVAKGYPEEFIRKMLETSKHSEGVREFMLMWRDEADDDEQSNIIEDIQELIEDWEQPGLEECVYVRFDDLGSIAADIVSFKSSLRVKVDEWGGISKLARETGIPQPSLSRFFATPAMPRRTTLKKIARAMELSQIDIATEWSR